MNNADVPDKLRELRKVLHCTQAQLAERIGVSYWEIFHCEKRDITGSNQSKSFAKIKSYLELTGLQILADTPKTTHLPVFFEGHCYCIHSKLKFGYKHALWPAFSNDAFECSYRFIYLHKNGKHHVFREINGGWTRTYTDAQLVGKRILEVNI